jgi:ornithine cyclodeaminase/alanine dehydrogenase-like protein (mu-crystallin family)
LTLLLSEGEVAGLLDMKEVVPAVEEAFRQEGLREAANSSRTRTRTRGAVLNVMHASLPYLGRAGVKCTQRGTKFVFVLFDLDDSAPLAVLGADNLGRFRTGAASGVATKYLYARPSARLAVLGSGRQALTQVEAVAQVTSLAEVRVWSPREEHRHAFVRTLNQGGFGASACDSPRAALDGADVASSITSAHEPFIDEGMLGSVLHMNICGVNDPGHAEVKSAALGMFGTVAVDNLPQAATEYGDLIRAASDGSFSWDSVVELKDVVSGQKKPVGRTIFKSGGVAIEDVAVASLVYDEAMKSGRFPDNEFALS